MLFVINSSVCDALDFTTTPNEKLVEGIENIARARRLGKHQVVARLDVLEKLSRSEHLSVQVQAIYRHLHNRYSTLGALQQGLNRRVEVVGDDGVPGILVSHDNRVVQIPASFFADFSRVSEVIFLCENQTDVCFYLKLARIFLTWSGLGNLSIDCEGRGAGGSTLAVEYETICKENRRFCVCISDSDRKYPGHDGGDTARALLLVDTKYRTTTKELRILDAREAENLVPTELIREAIQDDPNRMPGVFFLERLLASSTPEAYHYWDMKMGLKLGDVLNASRSPFCRYWLTIADELRNHLTEVDWDCWNSLRCGNASQCSCRIGRGVGQGILGDVIDFLEHNTRQKAAESIQATFRSRWSELGLVLVSWLCASEPIRAL